MIWDNDIKQENIYIIRLLYLNLVYLNDGGFMRKRKVSTAKWENMFLQAKAFYKEKGNLKVPFLHKTPTGDSLGIWVSNMRQRYNGVIEPSLNKEQIKQLESIGMVWSIKKPWDEYYDLAKDYYIAHGNLFINKGYVTKDGIKLGEWIANNRASPKRKIRTYKLTEDRIKKLNDIGMMWEVENNGWDNNYEIAKNYFIVYGNLLVPQNYIDKNGVKLGKWIAKMRGRYHHKKGLSSLSEEKVKLLDSIGMVWQVVDPPDWEKWYDMAQEYYDIHKNLLIPSTYVTKDGANLGRWLYRLKRVYDGKQKGILSAEMIAKLEEIGMVWQ
jgi:hypothetical protein